MIIDIFNLALIAVLYGIAALLNQINITLPDIASTLLPWTNILGSLNFYFPFTETWAYIKILIGFQITLLLTSFSIWISKTVVNRKI